MNHYHIYDILNTIHIFILISIVLGSTILPNKLPMFSVVFQIYIALFLGIKYNPFQKAEFHKNDQDIIFSASIGLLISQLIHFSYFYKFFHYV